MTVPGRFLVGSWLGRSYFLALVVYFGVVHIFGVGHIFWRWLHLLPGVGPFSSWCVFGAGAFWCRCVLVLVLFGAVAFRCWVAGGGF